MLAREKGRSQGAPSHSCPHADVLRLRRDVAGCHPAVHRFAGLEEALEAGQHLRPTAGYGVDEVRAVLDLVSDGEFHRVAIPFDVESGARVAFGLELRLPLVTPGEDEAARAVGLCHRAAVRDPAILEHHAPRRAGL